MSLRDLKVLAAPTVGALGEAGVAANAYCISKTSNAADEVLSPALRGLQSIRTSALLVLVMSRHYCA